MTIYFDGRPLKPATRNWGPGVCLQNLLPLISKSWSLSGISNVDTDLPAQIPNVRVPSFPFVRTFLHDLFASCHLSRKDIYWGTNHFLPYRVPCSSVLTVHDDMLFSRPEEQSALLRHYLAYRFKKSLLIASKIVCVSETTAANIRNRFPIFAQKISVIYNGFDVLPSMANKSGNESERYFIVLGLHTLRKNPEPAMEGLRKLLEKYQPIKLIVTGDIHPRFSQLIDSLDGSVVKVGMVNRNQLGSLLSGAVALLYPSLYEGFGLPIIEAQSVGCPVIASDLPIFREIGGEAITIAENSAIAWGNSMEKLLASPEMREQQIQRGFKNLERFSWGRSASSYSEIFEHLMERGA